MSSCSNANHWRFSINWVNSYSMLKIPWDIILLIWYLIFLINFFVSLRSSFNFLNFWSYIFISYKLFEWVIISIIFIFFLILSRINFDHILFTFIIIKIIFLNSWYLVFAATRIVLPFLFPKRIHFIEFTQLWFLWLGFGVLRAILYWRLIL
jgi:hypothetical protein